MAASGEPRRLPRHSGGGTPQGRGSSAGGAHPLAGMATATRMRRIVGAMLALVVVAALVQQWSSAVSTHKIFLCNKISAAGTGGLGDSRHLQMQLGAQATVVAGMASTSSSSNNSSNSSSSSSSSSRSASNGNGSGSGSGGSIIGRSNSSSSSDSSSASGGGAGNNSVPSSSSSSSSSRSSKGVSFTAVHPQLRGVDVRKLSPTIWGRMQKAGHLAWEHWSIMRHDALEARFDSFLAWRLKRTLAGPPVHSAASYTCRGADHPPRPFPGCHVFINHKYKYIYIRSPKAASTSIVDEFGECNNVRTHGFNASTCMGMHSSWEHFFKDPRNITDMWRDYYVFGFVRNPWNRAYSLYKYMQSDGCMKKPALNIPRCHRDWGTFCVDPWGSSDAVADMGCLFRSKSYMYFHMMDQYRCMITADGKWAVDFIGRVEQANEDWAQVVKEINARRDPSLPPVPFNPLVPKNVRSGSVSDPYGGANTHCLDAVSSWYACDIERFGYLASAAGGGNGRLPAKLH